MDDKKRSISEIYDLPKSELTEEELERLFDYEANKRFMSMQAEAERIMIQESLNEQIKITQESVDYSKSLLDKLCEDADMRYKNAK